MDFYDFLAFLGFALFVLGVMLWSVPAGFIVAGLFLMAFGLFGAKANAGTTVPEKQSDTE